MFKLAQIGNSSLTEKYNDKFEPEMKILVETLFECEVTYMKQNGGDIKESTLISYLKKYGSTKGDIIDPLITGYESIQPEIKKFEFLTYPKVDLNQLQGIVDTYKLTKGNKSKHVANCVFCGRSGVTKQHMWPDWLKTIIPREGSTSGQMIFHVRMAPMNKAVIIQPDVKERRWHQGAHKIRNVCGQCNSGWMSRLETAAKPHLTSLILGKKCNLDKQAQHSLAAWIVMTSIMAEFTDIKTVSIPAIHRNQLRISGNPPDGWQIWTGRYHGSNGNSDINILELA